jgi:SulP family sulfate permease
MFDLIRAHRASAKDDILSGITVALALVPEAVAFAFVAGVEPMVGLYAAFMMGLLTAVFGGRPGMISGATGAMAVVLVSLVAEHGIQYMFAAVILAGIIQMLAGIFRLGKFIRLVPHPVMLGFVNGLAIVIFLAQLGQFMVKDPHGMWVWMEGSTLYTMIALLLLTMAIIHYLPKLTTAIPSSLAAILVVTGIAIFFQLDARNVIDFVRDMVPAEQAATASLKGTLPTFAIPQVPFTLQTLWIILPYSFILAAVGLIESLLTMTLIDEVTNTRGRGNQECLGQGLANTVNGFFGAMGGCAMIGQSMININSGGRTRLSGITAALLLLFFILFASPLIEMIPLAALVGVMFMVVLGTFEWSSFRIIRKIPKSDAIVLVLVSGVTVATDLAMAVVVGVIVSALVFAWKHAQTIHAKTSIDENGSKIYEINGPIFFGSVANFKELFTPEEDPADVIVELQYSRIADHSGVEALDGLADKYIALGKQLHIRHVSPECRTLLRKAGDLCEVNMLEDPIYHVATDALE